MGSTRFQKVTVRADATEVRQLASTLFTDKEPTPQVFAEMLQRLFTATVFATGEKLVSGYDDQYATVGARLGTAFRLNNGLFLKFRMSYSYNRAENDLTIVESNFQYQLDEARMSKKYLFRYDYTKTSGKQDHPAMHLQINGSLAEHESVEKKLPKIRFPVNRLGVESMLRFLVTDFGIKPNAENWADVLDASEPAFMDYQAEKRLNK